MLSYVAVVSECRCFVHREAALAYAEHLRRNPSLRPASNVPTVQEGSTFAGGLPEGMTCLLVV